MIDLKSRLGRSMNTMRCFLDRPISVAAGTLTIGLSDSILREQAREEKRQRIRQMKRDLYRLLEQHPSSRELMRHLDLVERTLRRTGFKGLGTLPLRVITKALTEMESLVSDWSPTGLAELRSRMAVMVKEREHEADQDSISTASLELHMPNAADVTEEEHAMFEEMERSWAGKMPDGLANVPGRNSS